jgi:phosphoribosylamine--glycine ligase
MNVAVIGSGGREHALVKKLYHSKSVDKVVAIPGNAGMVEQAEVIYGVSENNFEAIAGVCIEKQVDWVIVGPEAPLAEGLADFLEDEYDLNVFGPRQSEARLESSKAFSKDIMKKYNIPTAEYETFTDYGAARDYIQSIGAPVVIKKDGLAAGKGVVVAETIDDALKGLESMMEKGNDSEPVVIEEYLEGEEFSLMVLVNEEYTHAFEIIAQDHKRAFDGDEGPNTGGMGAYAPVTHISEEKREEAVREIVQPMADALVAEGLSYFGVMYLGAMVTSDGVKVIEFNARFGDPEAQVLLSLLENDFAEVLQNVKDKKPFTLKWKDGYSVGVMLASRGYPGVYEKGLRVDIDEAVKEKTYISGLSQTEDGDYITSGGRVLLVTGEGETIDQACKEAYHNVEAVRCAEDVLFFRSDIAHKAL